MDFYFDEYLPPRVANAINALEEGEGFFLNDKVPVIHFIMSV